MKCPNLGSINIFKYFAHCARNCITFDQNLPLQVLVGWFYVCGYFYDDATPETEKKFLNFFLPTWVSLSDINLNQYPIYGATLHILSRLVASKLIEESEKKHNNILKKVTLASIYCLFYGWDVYVYMCKRIASKGGQITINIPAVYMAGYIMIWGGQDPLRGAHPFQCLE